MSRSAEVDAGAQPSCSGCGVRSLAIYGGMASPDFQGIARLRRDVRHLKAKRIIHRERETLDTVYTLLKGWAFRFRLLDDGRRQILSFLLPGSSIGMPLHASTRMHFSVQALTDVSLCVFDRAELAGYWASTASGWSSLEACYARLCGAGDERLIDIGRRSARERVASLILDLRRRLAGANERANETLHFPLRRQHIADALGLTPVHVGRVLRQFAVDGVISYDRDALTVLDLKALSDLLR